MYELPPRVRSSKVYSGQRHESTADHTSKIRARQLKRTRVHRLTLRTSEGSGGLEPLFWIFPNRLRFRMVKQRPKPDSSSPVALTALH